MYVNVSESIDYGFWLKLYDDLHVWRTVFCKDEDKVEDTR